jgi:hypothetical protein
MTQTVQVHVQDGQHGDTASLYAWLSEVSRLRVHGELELVSAPGRPGDMGGVDPAWISCAISAVVPAVELVTKIIEWRRVRPQTRRPVVTITAVTVIDTDDVDRAGDLADGLGD